jgi:hypothetical protein
MYYFYCPNCGKEENVEKLPRGTVGNMRGGYGTPIHHYECSECHNLDAGFMNMKCFKKEDEEYTKEYFREVIEIYQGIRGFKEDKKL